MQNILFVNSSSMPRTSIYGLAENLPKEYNSTIIQPISIHTKYGNIESNNPQVNIIKIPVKMSGELVLEDKGDTLEKGRLIELNVRNNENIKKLEARLRIKSLETNKSKVGVFVHSFTLASDFLNLIGDASELILRRKLSEILRNLQSYCKSNDINNLIEEI